MSVVSSNVGSERLTSGNIGRGTVILIGGESGMVLLKVELLMFKVVFVRLFVLFVMFC